MTALLARISLGPGRLPELLVPCETEIVQNPWLTWAVRVHQSRNLGVRVDCDELGSELLILHDIDSVSIVLVPHFFQCDTHLRPITTKYKWASFSYFNGHLCLSGVWVRVGRKNEHPKRPACVLKGIGLRALIFVDHSKLIQWEREC